MIDNIFQSPLLEEEPTHQAEQNGPAQMRCFYLLLSTAIYSVIFEARLVLLIQLIS